MKKNEERQLILMTGATGAVGPRIVSALIETGYSLRTLSLAAPPTSAWPVGVYVRFGDVKDLAMLPARNARI